MAIVPVRRDKTTTPFFDGTARGELLIVRDKTTGEHLDPKVDVTLEPERYEYVPAAGTGTVISWSIVHDKGPDGPLEPFAVAIVELDEGPWWWTGLQDVDVTADLDGMRVKAIFVKSGPGEEDETVPVFVPA